MEDSFFSAARAGDLSTLQTCLDSRVGIETRERQGRTALMLAAESGQYDAIRVLLKNGADVNAKSRDLQLTSLMYAIINNRIDCAEYLLTKGADVDARDGAERTPLILAVQYKNAQLVQVLLRENADPNLSDTEGRTALAIASYYNYEEIVKLIDASYKTKASHDASPSRFEI